MNMRRHRNAKIVATLGPSSSSPEMIRALFEAGADVFRFNFSHGIQVKYCERDIIEPAQRHTNALGLPNDAIFLMAFYESNPEQAPGLQKAIKSKKPPASLSAGGKPWHWNSPPSHLSSASQDMWRTLLVWQAMCPRPQSGKKFRIRNRNVGFFSEYLAAQFKLPRERVVDG